MTWLIKQKFLHPQNRDEGRCALRGTTQITVAGCRLNVANQLSLEFTITGETVTDYFAENSTFNIELSTSFTDEVLLQETGEFSLCAPDGR
jgi:hypothetical protein